MSVVGLSPPSGIQGEAETFL